VERPHPTLINGKWFYPALEIDIYLGELALIADQMRRDRDMWKLAALGPH